MDKVNLQNLEDQLFKAGMNSYAVIDGAAMPALLGKLEDYELEHTCLFRGELPFDLAEAAPYLVRLEKGNEFSSWLLTECTEVPCCIYVHSEDNFFTVRKHFRSFLKVNSPDGKILHFRYYDPRVLETYLPTCIDEDFEILFQNVTAYLLFKQQENQLKKYSEEILRKLSEDELLKDKNDISEETKIEEKSSLPNSSAVDVSEEKNHHSQGKHSQKY